MPGLARRWNWGSRLVCVSPAGWLRRYSSAPGILKSFGLQRISAPIGYLSTAVGFGFTALSLSGFAPTLPISVSYVVLAARGMSWLHCIEVMSFCESPPWAIALLNVGWSCLLDGWFAASIVAARVPHGFLRLRLNSIQLTKLSRCRLECCSLPPVDRSIIQKTLIYVNTLKQQAGCEKAVGYRVIADAKCSGTYATNASR